MVVFLVVAVGYSWCFWDDLLLGFLILAGAFLTVGVWVCVVAFVFGFCILALLVVILLVVLVSCGLLCYIYLAFLG